MAKKAKRSHHKIILPVVSEAQVAEPVLAEVLPLKLDSPVPTVPAPLPAILGTVTINKSPMDGTEYITFMPDAPGHEIPHEIMNGQKVRITISPA